MTETPAIDDPISTSQYTYFLRKLKKSTDVPGVTPYRISMPDGVSMNVGGSSPVFSVIVKNPRAVGAIATLDEGIIANAYVDGWIDIEGNFARCFDLRMQLSDRHPLQWAWRFIAPLLFGQVRLNKSSISQHYNRDAAFFLSFLDPTHRCYTQGIYTHANEPVELAMQRKFDFCIDACQLKPGSRVLEVGPGWGAFSEYAGQREIHVTGLTISEASLEFMIDLSKAQALPIDMRLEDILSYKSEEQYDAIVLMGIMEHLPDYPRVLKQFMRYLKPSGHVFLDACANRVKYKHSSFITEHIYPTNHSFFDLADFLKAVKKTPFQVRGVWDDRESYHYTFVNWAKRFESNRDFLVENYGEAEYRKFRLYLWGAAHGFLHDKLQCYRVVLRKPIEDELRKI